MCMHCLYTVKAHLHASIFYCFFYGKSMLVSGLGYVYGDSFWSIGEQSINFKNFTFRNSMTNISGINTRFRVSP